LVVVVLLMPVLLAVELASVVHVALLLELLPFAAGGLVLLLLLLAHAA
jgi:hypothetical protein